MCVYVCVCVCVTYCVVFGEKFGNVNKTVSNIYKGMFGDSISQIKHLPAKVRIARRREVEEGVVLERPGNPSFQRYLTDDEEEMVASFLSTCNFMHMPFDRQCFRGLIVSIAEVMVTMVV